MKMMMMISFYFTLTWESFRLENEWQFFSDMKCTSWTLDWGIIIVSKVHGR